MKRIILIAILALTVLSVGACGSDTCQICGLTPGLQIQIDYANPCGTQIQAVTYAGADGCVTIQNCDIVNSIYAQ